MARQTLRPGSPSNASESAERTRQAKSPSLARDLLMLGDIYVTLAWLAYKRIIHGPLWPWETRAHSRAASVITLVRPEEEAEGSSETASPKGG